MREEAVEKGREVVVGVKPETRRTTSFCMLCEFWSNEIRSIIGSSISFLSLLTRNVLRTECLPIALPGELVGGLFQVQRSVEDGEYGPAIRLYAAYAYLCAYTFLCYRLLQLYYFTIHPVPHQAPDPSPRTHSSECQAVP